MPTTDSQLRISRRAALTAMGAFGAAACARPERPNVVFIFSDQHRAVSMPGEPHTSVIAPTLERLSSEGAVFRNAISNYPVCSPYRAMLMSGRAPFKSGVVENRILLRENGNSFGNIFQRAGYRTGYIGKWHLGGEENAHPGMHGFEFFEPWVVSSQHNKSRFWDQDKGAYVPCTEYNATAMTDHAMAFIERNKEHPFLLMLSLNPPHPNYFDAPEAFRDLYKGTELAWRPNLRHEADPGFSLWLRGNRAVDEIHRGYLAHISAIDHEIGRIVDRLETLGLSERTVVIYSADHGDMLGSHGRMGKRQPFEESIRIPLIARWKGRITPGMHLNTLIGVIDFIPTITGLAGVPAPDGLDGHDLSGVLRGEKTEEPEFQPIMHIFRDLAGAPNHPAEIFRGVRTQRFTYAATIAKDFVLYDLERDPYQLKNVIDDPAYATELERLQSLTAQWMREWEDPFRLPRAAQAALLDAGG